MSQPTPDPDWSRFAADLERGIIALSDGQALTLTVRSSARRAVTRKKSFYGLIPAKVSDIDPFIRLTRSEDHLRGACIGSPRTGGLFPYTDEEHDRLTELGWRATTRDETAHFVRWWPDDVTEEPYLPARLVHSAVGCAVATLQDCIRATDPAHVIMSTTE